MIPSHSSCLDFSNYTLYMGSILNPFSNQPLDANKIWEPILGTCHITPTPTGRHALWYFLEQSNLKKGDEVLVSAYNFYVVIQLIVQKGLIPIFVDIDPETLCIDAEDLSKKITKNSRMVLVTHMFGNPADIKNISHICKLNNLLLFEDCAHGVGSYCGNIHVGTSCDGSLFSFGIYKTINSFGGGMLVQNESSAINKFVKQQQYAIPRMKSFLDNFIRFVTTILMTPFFYTIILHPFLKFLKRHKPQLYHYIEPSKSNSDYSFRVNTRAPFKPFMLKMISHQLLKLNNNVSIRKEIVKLIKCKLVNINEVKLLNEDKFGKSNYSYFGIYVPDPYALAKYLEEKRIISNPHEFCDCSNLPQFSKFKNTCKHASYANKHLLRLPNYPCLKDNEIKRITLSIGSFY